MAFCLEAYKSPCWTVEPARSEDIAQGRSEEKPLQIQPHREIGKENVCLQRMKEEESTKTNPHLCQQTDTHDLNDQMDREVAGHSDKMFHSNVYSIIIYYNVNSKP